MFIIKKFVNVKDIYPFERNVDSANRLDDQANYLHFTKGDDLIFHIVSFPCLSSNIPSGPSYGI